MKITKGRLARVAVKER